MRYYIIAFIYNIFIINIAFSQEITIRSDTISLEKSLKDFSLPKIWAIVIGISKYQKTDISLKYADKDALAFYNFLLSPYGGSVKKENSALLLNENATRENILKEVNDKLNRAFDDDLIIIYISGHGMPDPVGSEVYFLSYESKPENLAGTAVSQIDIEKALTRTKARKKIWIVDACHSGGAGLAIKGNLAYLTNKLLMEIAVSKDGLAMFTASSSSEFSVESDKWGLGHGVFTYYLLEGLKGEADQDKDGLVRLRELYDYVYHKVNEATDGKQHPELKGNFDNNLPLGIIK